MHDLKEQLMKTVKKVFGDNSNDSSINLANITKEEFDSDISLNSEKLNMLRTYMIIVVEQDEKYIASLF